MYPKKHWLTALLVVALIGLVACSKPQSGDEAPDVSSQPVLPTAVEITDGIDGPEADLHPPGQSTIESNLMLPFVINQPVPPAPVEGPVDINCTDTDPHPIGLSIAETYAVSYQQVMTWFCNGYSFENILVALETSEAVDISANALLQMLLEKKWEEIWDELGFVNNR